MRVSWVLILAVVACGTESEGDSGAGDGPSDPRQLDGIELATVRTGIYNGLIAVDSTCVFDGEAPRDDEVIWSLSSLDRCLSTADRRLYTAS